MTDRIKLSVVMPTYNEEKAIGKVIADIRKNSSGVEHEIVVVDGSSDKTAEIAAKFGARVIKQSPRGHGTALAHGLKNAMGDIVITTDCDDTYPMNMIPRLMEMVGTQNYDLVSCNRLTQELGNEMPFSNKFANMVFALIVRFLYGIKTSDVTTGMFAMKGSVARDMAWETNYSLPAEIIIKSNLSQLRYCEVPIRYHPRIGKSTLPKWRSGKAYLKCFLKYKFFPWIDPKNI